MTVLSHETPVPPQGLPNPAVLMRHNFQEAAAETKPTIDEEALAIKSGFYDSRNAYSLFRSTGEMNSHTDDDPEKKKKRDQERYMAQVFSYGGMNFSFGTIIENLGSMANSVTEKITSNVKAMTLKDIQIARYPDGTQIMTAEDLKAFEDGLPYCVVIDLKSADQITIVDGIALDAELYTELTHQNEELVLEQERIEQYSVQLQAGDVTWDDVPEDIKQGIAEVEENKTRVPEPEPTVLEMMNTMDATDLGATMPDMKYTAPTVSYSTPSF